MSQENTLMSQENAGFNGMRVLVAEDEILVSMVIEQMLGDLDCHVVGPFATLSAAMEGCRKESCDVALIDMNLAGESADPLLAELSALSVPFVIASGATTSDLDHRPTVILNKPYGFDQLASAVATLHRAYTQSG